MYAACGSVVLLLLDLAFTRGRTPAPGLTRLLELRLGWLAVPAVGWRLKHASPRWRGLPAVTILLSLVYTWGNDWTYLMLGMGGRVIHVLGVLVCFVTAAALMPTTTAERTGVFALMAGGHLALDLGVPIGRPLAERLWTDLALLVFVAVTAAVFSGFSASHRRRYAYRCDLERSVAALEESRRRADESAAALRQLAAEVAHEVSNPLAALKANVGWLGDPGPGPAEPAERAEVIRETLLAIDRIHRIVERLQLGREGKA